MDNFQIETAQNVTITQKAAGIGERMLGFLIDSIIIVAYLFFTAYILGTASVDDEWVFYLILGVPPMLYHLLLEALWDGRTPGKAALNMRVVKLDGSKPGFGSFFIRWIMRLIDITLSSGGVATLTILLNGKGQRLGDMAAGTTVINERKKVRLSHTLLEDIPEGYEAKYPQVTVFNDRDVQKIKTVFMKAKTHGNHNVILKLAERLAKQMQVTPDEKPLLFVDRVLKDYNFYTQQ